MNPAQAMALGLVAAGALGLGAATAYAAAGRVGRTGRGGGAPVRTVLARAGSYLALATALAVAVLLGVAGIAVLLTAIAAAALLEWARLAQLPRRHVLATQAANLFVMATVAWRGTAAADVLVAGLAFAAALLPVVRPDTTRAFRDFGAAAAGLIVITVMLVHGVALVVEHQAVGAALVAAVAVGCAGSDVGAYVAGRRWGRTPLAPSLSPNKTREGLIGNVVGAAVGVAIAAPALASTIGVPGLVGLAVVVAAGSLWGDLLESAAKREFGVKDAGTWLPGFGGILDRVDSLLLALPLVYWAARLLGLGA